MSDTSKKNKVTVFVIMLASAYWVRILGQLYLVEIILLAYSTLSLFKKSSFSYLSDKRMSRYFLYLFLAFLGQVISDVIRETNTISAAKGSALILCTMINLHGLILLTRKDIYILHIAVAGWATGIIIGFFLQPSEYANQFPWKFGLGYPVSVLIAIYLSKSQKSSLEIVSLTVALVAVDLFFNSRSLAAITFISTSLALRGKSKNKNRVKLKSKPLKSIVTLILLVMFFYSIYATLASRGNLGFEVQKKYLVQSSSSLGILISGRTEVVSEYYAIRESPIIGYGSYAPLTSKIREKVVNTLLKNGIDPSIRELRYGVDYRIPVHSGIFEFWLWFGILGVPFFLYLLINCFRVILTHQISPLLAFLTIQGFWDILFSPYAADRRIQIPLTILLVHYNLLEKSVSSKL